MINHTVLDAIRSYVDEQGLVGAVLMDSDLDGIAEAIDAALHPPVPEFSDDTLVEITDDNSAHAVMDEYIGKWACDGDSASYVALAMRGGRRESRKWKRMTWAQTRDKAYKPWPAWPCQTCVSRMQDYMP